MFGVRASVERPGFFEGNKVLGTLRFWVMLSKG